MSVLLDSYALIALLTDEPAADEVETLLRRGDVGTTAIHFAEALDALQRLYGIPRERIDTATAQLVSECITLLPVDWSIARDAADIRARRYDPASGPITLNDFILIAASRSAESTLATTDEPLARVARAEGVPVTELRTV